MKKINLLLASALLASSAFLTSCTKDQTATPPTIKFINTNGYITGDVAVPAGSDIAFGVNAQSGGTANLSHFKITRAFGGSTIVAYETPLDSIAYITEFQGQANEQVGIETWTFTITDADGQTAQISFMITTTEAPINTYQAILLGGQLNPDLGSFYSTGNNTVMKIAVARANPTDADFVYYYGETNKASIVAIADAQLQGIPAFVECSTWAVKNDTKFKLTSGIDWSAITSASSITAAATNLTETHVNMLAVGDIVAFETASTSSNPGKTGLYKVLEINGSSPADRSIKIEVKIQK
jgi:hypothetical protein